MYPRLSTPPSIRRSSSYHPINHQGGFEGQLSGRSLILLTCPFVGIQVVWVIQQAFGIPHLLTIGFTNSEITLILLAGPVSGLLIPAILAIVGDGSRRFSIICGGLGVMVALLSLAWAQEIACLFMLIFHIRSEAAMAPAAKFIAVFAAYTLNIAMQPLNISLRALLMDICPPRQQATASLWIMRLSATGSVLVTSIAFFSSPSFKLLSVVCCTALFLLLALHTLEARYYYSTEERQSWKLEKGTIRSYVSRVRQLGIKATHMPNITHRVCRTQLFSWFGWFPALFYMGSVVSQSYTLSAAKRGRSSPIEEAETASAGTVLMFHFVVLVTTIALQMLSKARPKPSYSHIEEDGSTVADDNYIMEYGTKLFRVWSSILAISAFAFVAVTLLSRVDGAAALIIASMGACFAVSNWIPYALLGIDLAMENRRSTKSEETESLNCSRVGDESDEDTESFDFRRGRIDELDGATATLTIHNAAICIPQIASAIAATLLFHCVERVGWRVDVSWVFLIAAPAVLVAAWDRETWRKR